MELASVSRYSFIILVLFLFFSLNCSFASDFNDDSLDMDLENANNIYIQNQDSPIDYSTSSSSDDDLIGSVSSDVLVDDDGAVDDSDEWVVNFEEDSTDDWEDVDYDAGRVDFPDRGDDRVASHFVASSFSKYYRNGTQLVGYLMDSDDNPIVGRNVSIGINNNVYYKITDETGMFLLNINLRPRNYTTVIDFAGDETYAPCSKTILIKVFTMPTSIIASNLVKYYKDDSQLVARLLDTHGNPLSGHNVTISIANVDYIKTTDDDGYAYLNINLQPSVRNATINFTENGYKSSKKTISVTVKVMPISLTSENVIKHYRNGTQWSARLLDVHGNPLANKTIVFNVASNDYTKTTDDEGYAYLDINLRPSTRNGIVSFNAPYYYNSSKTVTITVLNPPEPISSPINGFYNTSNLLVNLYAYHEAANIFYSFDNGANWIENLAQSTFHLCEGNWTIKSYVSLDGYTSTIGTYDFEIGNINSQVWFSQISRIYDEPFNLTLNKVGSNNDLIIYYTLDGSEPTINSEVYSGHIPILNTSNRTVLKFIVSDDQGNCSDTVILIVSLGIWLQI